MGKNWADFRAGGKVPPKTDGKEFNFAFMDEAGKMPFDNKYSSRESTEDFMRRMEASTEAFKAFADALPKFSFSYVPKYDPDSQMKDGKKPVCIVDVFHSGHCVIAQNFSVLCCSRKEAVNKVISLKGAYSCVCSVSGVGLAFKFYDHD